MLDVLTVGSQLAGINQNSIRPTNPILYITSNLSITFRVEHPDFHRRAEMPSPFNFHFMHFVRRPHKYILRDSFQTFTWKWPSESHRNSLPKGRHIPSSSGPPRSFITMYVNVGFVVDKVACGRLFSGYCGVPLPVFTSPVLRFIYNFPCDTKKARPVRNLSLVRSLPEFPTWLSTLMKSKQRSPLF